MIGSGWLKLAGVLLVVGLLMNLLGALIQRDAKPKPIQGRAPVSNCGHFERQFLNLPSCDR